jgi:hypothetical protein
MSDWANAPITWKTAVRLALGFAGEYALLALIEDAPAALKVATVLCAAGALAAMESQDWLNKRRHNLFAQIIGTIATIYLMAIAYGIVHYLEKLSVRHGLEARYIESSELVGRELTVTDPQYGIPDQAAVDRLEADAKAWERETAAWIESHIGPAARERFLDAGSKTAWMWGKGPSYDIRYSNILNTISGKRKNLTVLLETNAYGD